MAATGAANRVDFRAARAQVFDSTGRTHL